LSSSLDGQGKNLVRRVIHDPRAQAGAEAKIQWGELRERIFWPAGADSILSISDPALPAVGALMKVSPGPGGGEMKGLQCRTHAVEITGAMQGDAQESVRSISISGKGEALVCDGERLPRAASMRISRIVVPALWKARRPDEAINEKIEVAWARLP